MQCLVADQIVDFRMLVAAMVDERRPAIQRVLNRLGHVGFCRERRESCFEPAFHVVEQRHIRPGRSQLPLEVEQQLKVSLQTTLETTHMARRATAAR